MLMSVCYQLICIVIISQITANFVMQEKTKHYDIDVHLIREKDSSGLIKTVSVGSKDQTGDVFTKALGTAQHGVMVKRLGMVNLFVSSV